MADRRTHDPYAPPSTMTTQQPDSESLAPSSSNSPTDAGPTTGAESDGLDLMKRVDLVRLAQREGVAAYGTKDELLARIRSHRGNRQV